MNHNDQESLKRSHSKSSNAKLTLLCLIASISLMGLVVFLGAMIANFIEAKYAYIGAGGCGALTILCLVLFSSFKR